MEFRKYYNLNRPGVTLIEVLITMTVISLLAGFGTTTLAQARRQASASTGIDDVKAHIREAQSRSMIAQDGQAWGLRCDGEQVIYFTFTTTGEVEQEHRPLLEKTDCRGTELRFLKLIGQAAETGDWTVGYDGHETGRIHITLGGLITSVSI